VCGIFSYGGFFVRKIRLKIRLTKINLKTNRIFPDILLLYQAIICDFL
jgi:hypothetical protein